MLRITGAILILTLALACGATRRADPGEGKGFLDDYSKLEPGGSGEAQLRWISPDADFTRYDKVIIDPVTFWRGSDAKAGLSTEQRQALANYFHATAHKEVSKYFTVVQHPTEGAMRFTAAITRLGDRNVTMDTVSTYIPQMRLVAEAKGLFTGKPAFVGEAVLEGRLTDAWSGDLLAAAMDRRVGGKSFKGMDDWADVRAAIDAWAVKFSSNMCRRAQRPNCPS
ncbi:MAG: DUF3313 domain-containing protein [Deltaproteobacteria bacterium]|nr:DUF3313 domain-containing protein [Deltaproteobacteria bacterium]